MKKLSFVTPEDSDTDVLAALSAAERPELREEIEYIKDGFCASADEDVEYAFSLIGDCLAVRVFDMGRYLFPYPFALTERADLSDAVEHIVSYCVREELPAVFTDVPEEELSRFFSLGYKDVRVRRERSEEGTEPSFRVSLLTECTELCEVPSLESGRLSIGALRPDDVHEYARICKDTDNIALWGYDYREDMPNAADEDFYNSANSELERGVALTVAIRLDGALIGEAIFYAFDAKGGADFAFRLLPEHRGRGLSRTIVPLIYDCARRIGLQRLSADIMCDNAASCRMASKTMALLSTDGRVNRYTAEL